MNRVDCLMALQGVDMNVLSSAVLRVQMAEMAVRLW